MVSLSARFQDMPIKRRLTLISLAISGFALIAMSLIVTVREGIEWHGRILEEAETCARVIGINVAPALISGNRILAGKMLAGLSENPRLFHVVIYDNNKKIFAGYRASNHAHGALPYLQPGTSRLSFTEMLISKPIESNGKILGSIVLEADPMALYEDLLRDTGLTFISAFGLFMVSIYLFSKLQKTIVDPIIDLAQGMQAVSEGRSYVSRVPAQGKDEIGVLTRAFRGMVARIQLRESELEQHRTQFEEEVDRRTAKLTEAQRIAHIGNWEWYIAENRLNWSDEVCRIFGVTRQQFGANYEAFLSTVYPEDRESVDARVHEALQRGRPCSLDHRIVLPDGAVRHVHEEAEVYFSEDGHPLSMLGTVQDITEDKLAADALRKANDDLGLFRKLLDKSSDAIEVVDPVTLQYLDVNETACRTLGYSREELLTMGVTDIDPDLGKDTSRNIEKTMQKTGSARFESIHRRKDGSTFPVEISMESVNLDKAYVLGIVRDITERKQAAEALRQSEEKFRALVESTSDWIWEVDRAGRYTYASPRVEMLLGYKPEEVIGKSPFDFMTAEEVKRLTPVLGEALGSRAPLVAVENTNICKDGRQVILETSGMPFFDPNGEFSGYRGIDRDITERKMTAQALEESELRLRAILDAAVDGILMLDVQTQQFFSGNNAICDMLGYEADELRSLGIEDIHPAEALPEVQRQFERQLKGEIRVAPSLPVKRKDGSVFFADVSTSPIQIAEHPYMVGIFHDVTERKQTEDNIRMLNDDLEKKIQERTKQLLEAQEELLRKEKLAVLGQVAGSVGHELRNPLGVMNNAVYFLQTVLSDADETTREYLGIIRDEIANADRIVSDLLDSVRTKPPNLEAVGLTELVEQTLGKCNLPPSVTLKLDIPETLPRLRVDAMQIQQVLRNLVSNGVEAMPKGGTLEISAVENDGAVAVSVRDTGGGIAPEVRPRLFQPLFTTKARGIGLGLIVVKNLTLANGGTVDVQSEVGRGTTFTITLPCDDGDAKNAT